MSELRMNELLARMPRNGPWWVSVALAALIAVECARVAVALLGGGPVISPQQLPGRVDAGAEHPGVDVPRIVSKHLFGIAAADANSQDPDNAPPSSANLVLAGTIASEDPKHGLAIISDGGPSKVYAVGDRVGGAALHSVYLDHVILDRAGALETLVLPRLLLTGRSAPPPPARRSVAAVENIRRMVQQDPAILNEVMRTVASYDSKAGKLRGFRAYPGRNRAAFAKLGLKAGDLVTAINGTPLDDPQRSQEVLNTIQSSDQATVTIERGGQKQDITVNVAQVAADAARDLAAAESGAAPQPPAAGAGAGATDSVAQPPAPSNPPGAAPPPSNPNPNPNE